MIAVQHVIGGRRAGAASAEQDRSTLASSSNGNFATLTATFGLDRKGKHHNDVDASSIMHR